MEPIQTMINELFYILSFPESLKPGMGFALGAHPSLDCSHFECSGAICELRLDRAGLWACAETCPPASQCVPLPAFTLSRSSSLQFLGEVWEQMQRRMENPTPAKELVEVVQPWAIFLLPSTLWGFQRWSPCFAVWPWGLPSLVCLPRAGSGDTDHFLEKRREWNGKTLVAFICGLSLWGKATAYPTARPILVRKALTWAKGESVGPEAGRSSCWSHPWFLVSVDVIPSLIFKKNSYYLGVCK